MVRPLALFATAVPVSLAMPDDPLCPRGDSNLLRKLIPDREAPAGTAPRANGLQEELAHSGSVPGPSDLCVVLDPSSVPEQLELIL